MRVSDIGGKWLVELLAKARELYPDDKAKQSQFVKDAVDAKKREKWGDT